MSKSILQIRNLKKKNVNFTNFNKIAYGHQLIPNILTLKNFHTIFQPIIII